MGFEFVSQRGSYARFRKGINLVSKLVVPMSKRNTFWDFPFDCEASEFDFGGFCVGIAN